MVLEDMAYYQGRMAIQPLNKTNIDKNEGEIKVKSTLKIYQGVEKKIF